VRSLRVWRLGRVEYEDGLALMRLAADAVRAGNPPETERPQPPRRETARQHEREQHHEVVRPDHAEEVTERPERDAQQPAAEVCRCPGDGAKGVGIAPGRAAVLQLVAG